MYEKQTDAVLENVIWQYFARKQNGFIRKREELQQLDMLICNKVQTENGIQCIIIQLMTASAGHCEREVGHVWPLKDWIRQW